MHFALRIAVVMAASVVWPVLAATATYDCRFTTTATPKGLTTEPFELKFLIDTVAKKAYVVGNNGSSEVELVPSPYGGVSFIEITRSGNVLVTMITKSGEAAHSRNLVLGGALFRPSQSYGTCSRQ